VPAARLATTAVAALVALAALVPAASAAAKPGDPPRLDARAWLLVDARDGDRLAGSGISRELPIASATKLMTAYLALEELPLDRRLPAPAYQAFPAESVLGLHEGERSSVRDLLYALLMASANDAAVTLAEGVSGSVRDFVAEMNETAESLELTDTSYANPIGFDAPANRSSARDLAALALELMERNLFRRIVDTEETVVNADGRTLEIQTRNTLLFSEPWVNGIKTGHTLGAGYVLVGSATRKGANLVSVVLGAPSEAARDAESLELLDYGFSLYRPRTAVADGEPVTEVALSDQDEELRLVAGRPLRVSAREDQQVETTVSVPEEVEGPVSRGERLGTVTVTIDGSEAGSAPLVAARSADAASFGDKLRSRLPGPTALVLIGAVVILIGVALAFRGSAGRSRTEEERMTSRDERLQSRERERP
jgi:D-alanyl-D-alanine carboxypeptidase (penicillin-binding protein 5/6)